MFPSITPLFLSSPLFRLPAGSMESGRLLSAYGLTHQIVQPCGTQHAGKRKGMNTQDSPINLYTTNDKLIKAMEQLFQQAYQLILQGHQNTKEFKTILENVDTIDAELERRWYANLHNPTSNLPIIFEALPSAATVNKPHPPTPGHNAPRAAAPTGTGID